ncbi:hypothetical protein [Oceaniglobus ichthyenteri]|uniref:hypothetical protein n=1 Tax=Oceaniglobus ichthyenteri TaxID=2136177 RepID=UPI000D3AB3AF|nr:hypothetical protein [Oceaniglobus ichthyenteri]
MNKIIILERQAVIAQDLAEAIASVLPDAVIKISMSAADAMHDTLYDLAFVAGNFGNIEGQPAWQWMHNRAGRSVIVGAMDDRMAQDTPDIETLAWPFTEDSLGPILGRIVTAS